LSHSTEPEHEAPHVVPAAPLPLAPRKSQRDVSQLLGSLIFHARWVLYPVSLTLLVTLIPYVGYIVREDFVFIANMVLGRSEVDLESLMLLVLGSIDAYMVANLAVMIVMGSHQIFIERFRVPKEDTPQFLDHMDTGIQKVKVSMSVATITLMQLLKDFVHLSADASEWTLVWHRIVLHLVAVFSTISMAHVWSVMHPPHLSHSGDHK
jgi:uncharacterized protein (TIGR00645 family)